MEINHALVEETRPPIYTAMKYWGKKPHNIWREYIATYTPEDGVYLDPFAGSAISAFEAVKAGRKCIAFDINPLTSFLIETFCTPLDAERFSLYVQEIAAKIKNDETYQKFYLTKCRKCGNKEASIQNFKWEGKELYEVGIVCEECNDRYLEQPTQREKKLAGELNKIKIDAWYPPQQFHNSPSFSPNLISCLGGNHFYDLYTKRNLYILAKIFAEILKADQGLRSHLAFGFIQALHLCTKMNVPRRAAAERGFSTSWGRSAYICANRKMEMNPLLVFIQSCVGGKQSVTSCISGVKNYLGKIPKAVYVDYSNKKKNYSSFDIKYGIVDINGIQDFVAPESIDFILTDPPYGDLVQYLDLSSIWLTWLAKFDEKYRPQYNNEIIIKKGLVEFDDYARRFETAIKNLNLVLKDQGKAVFTFHNKKIKIWNSFLHSLKLGGFNIEKVIHQQNRRTGESNLANPYGTSAADFYLRCVKKDNLKVNDDLAEFKHYVIEKAIWLIAARNEPTPYQILFNGLLAEISSAGFDVTDFDKEIENILAPEIGKIFKLASNEINQAGAFWWFKEPGKYIKYPDKKLSDRVEETLSRFLRKRISVTFDEVLKEIFITYPNGLIPDINSITPILEKYAVKNSGRWNWKGLAAEQEFTMHTKILQALSEIGKKYGRSVYIGKREQPERYNGDSLAELADCRTLKHFVFEPEKQERIEMIDMLWYRNKKIDYAIEVENTTKFTADIQRASNLGRQVNKIMALPDERAQEFLNIKDPLFVDSFKKYNWSYIFYSDILKLRGYKKVTAPALALFLKQL